MKRVMGWLLIGDRLKKGGGTRATKGKSFEGVTYSALIGSLNTTRCSPGPS